MSNGNGQRVEVFTSLHSETRPAWTVEDLHAYRHRHVKTKGGGYVIQKEYYEKRRGIA